MLIFYENTRRIRRGNATGIHSSSEFHTPSGAMTHFLMYFLQALKAV